MAEKNKSQQGDEDQDDASYSQEQDVYGFKNLESDEEEEEEESLPHDFPPKADEPRSYSNEL